MRHRRGAPRRASSPPSPCPAATVAQGWRAAAAACVLAALAGLPAAGRCDDASAPARLPFPRLDTFVATGNGDEGEFRGAHVGVEFLAAPRMRVSITPQAGLLWAQNVEGNESLLAALDLQFRWYYLEWEAAALYLEGGGGLQYTTPKSFPATGTHLNGRLRFGAGARIALPAGLRLVGGYNWLHMSNGNALDPNVGHDGPMYYLGLSRSLR